MICTFTMEFAAKHSYGAHDPVLHGMEYYYLRSQLDDVSDQPNSLLLVQIFGWKRHIKPNRGSTIVDVEAQFTRALQRHE
jgi:hypothetical protein